MRSRANPEDINNARVIYTRPQDGFSLKNKAKDKIEERLAKNTTPVKKARPQQRKAGRIQGRRLFNMDDDDDISCAADAGSAMKSLKKQ